MENTPDAKYQKLASEYSKVRAQVNVLKRAVVEEQNKSSCMKEALRVKEATTRRLEQELDSLGFRNKQLEHRVAALQDDLDSDNRKTTKTKQSNNKNNKNLIYDLGGDPLVTEELQKRILENAQLVSALSDRSSEIDLCNSRIKELEEYLTKQGLKHAELECKLRKEVDHLTIRNQELEAKLVEATSIVGSEDCLSLNSSDHTPVHTNSNSTSSEDRIALLEKELYHWRTKCEMKQICDLINVGDKKANINGNQQVTTRPIDDTNPLTIPTELVDTTKTDEHKEHILYELYMKKLEDMYMQKCLAETKVTTYTSECATLQHNMKLLYNELKQREQELDNIKQLLKIADEDLATTRINYEEHISVLSEQIIGLSDQLAASK